ncbi:hypothetical protein IVB43_23705 [Bradyrhizobium sp. 48]|uniref:hypothetical protein n=1 Tax=Bradyrhizobium sp. 48 TaxID=2782676 RepID=UPI001FF742DB|nr:hypothetical protein [Bradyrhizobium sp. 48]MCK1445394.1 hypothetical protein [Bradyrhizobium sp. 48]
MTNSYPRFSAESCGLPWGINTIGTIYHADVSAGLPDGRWVAAVCEPCPPSLRERLRAAWWVFTGRAHAFIWPKAGDLETVFKRTWIERRPTPRAFTPAKNSDWNTL